MKNLFIVAVAIGIFSGTPISTKAQTSVNSLRSADGSSGLKSVKFIEGIEISRDFNVNLPVTENKSVVTTTKTPVTSTAMLIQLKHVQPCNLSMLS
ncbi:MAG: hypothetical protein IPP48_12070 [Chitinophagaceae bacterium]|nr:hypothetical protein [Chitinophagaceae bacterium]